MLKPADVVVNTDARKVSDHDVRTSLTAAVSTDVTPPSVHKLSDVNWVRNASQLLIAIFEIIFFKLG
jgi:hypothetical protein